MSRKVRLINRPDEEIELVDDAEYESLRKLGWLVSEKQETAKDTNSAPTKIKEVRK